MLTRIRVECNTLLFEQLVSIISIHSAACFFRNHQFFSQSARSDFMKPEVPLQCLQEPLTCRSSGSVVSKFLLKSESFSNNLFRTKDSSSRPNVKPDVNSLPALRDRLFNVFATALFILRRSSFIRTMLWWQRRMYHVIFVIGRALHSTCIFHWYDLQGKVFTRSCKYNLVAEDVTAVLLKTGHLGY